MTKPLTFLFLLALILTAKVGLCQIKSWNHTLYTTKDGLTGKAIRKIVQDKEGFLWIVTESGLCRFDGDEFISVLHDEKDSSSIPTDHLNFIAMSPFGKLLVSTSCGLFVMDTKTMHGHTIHANKTKEREALDDNFRNVYVNTKLQRIFAITSTAMLVFDYDMHLLNTVPYPYPVHDSLKLSFTHYAPLFLENGDIIFHDNYDTKLGLIDYKLKQFVSFGRMPSHPYFSMSRVSNVNCSAIDSAGNIWFHEYGKDTLFCCPPYKPLIRYPIKGKATSVLWTGQLLFPTKSKMMWAYRERETDILYELPYDSLVRNKGYEVQVNNPSGFTGSEYLVFTDRTGNMWFSTTLGLYLVKSNRRMIERIQLPFSFKLEAAWQYVYDMKFVNERELLITTNRTQCFLYDPAKNSMQTFARDEEIHKSSLYSMQSILPVNKQRRLIYGNGVFIFQNNQLIVRPKLNNEFEKLFTKYSAGKYFNDSQGNCWVSFEKYGLVRWNERKQELILFKPHGEFCSDDFTTMTEDASGNMWFVNYLQSALWKFNRHNQAFDSTKINLPFKWVRYLTAGEKDTLLMSAIDGLLIYDTKRQTYRKINMKEGLPSNNIKGLFYYRHHVFISSHNGLAILNSNDYSIRKLGQADGIEENITTKAYVLDTVHQVLYIGGNGYVYRVELHSLFDKGFQPTTIVENIQVNGRAIASVEKKLILASDQNNISFSVTSIDFYSGLNKNYYYRIIFNGDSSEWKSNNRLKKFSFLNMAPGNYRIDVKSTNALNLWSVNTASVTFEIVKPWYNQWWFYVLCICSIGIGLYLLYNNRIRQIKKIESIRNKLGRDLHDDIGSTLSSINILSRTAQRTAQHAGDERTASSLEKINDRSQRLLTNMSDIIWNINPGNDTVDELMSRMREYAIAMMEAKDIQYTFHFTSDKPRKLSMEMKSNLFLIFKEAVNNLVKYSGCTQAVLTLSFDEQQIHLRVEDNGQGFDIDEIKHRGGLSNMQHRAEEIKGEFSIQSAVGKGTRINLRIKQ